MSKKLRKLKFINQQVLAVANGHFPSTTRKLHPIERIDVLDLLCSITSCSAIECCECPIKRELDNCNG
ncbi:MAG: hypothetical protein RR853_04680 [Aurantimicrobium sp.]|uniref:hypothetical protein n=1 Tax=Bacillati TaxID=1783272 RepID=UPI002FC5D87A